MNLIALALALFLGMILGAGLTLIYIQYRMYSQVGQMEEQMEQLMQIDEEFGEKEEEN